MVLTRSLSHSPFLPLGACQGNYFDVRLIPSYISQLDDGISPFCGYIYQAGDFHVFRYYTTPHTIPLVSYLPYMSTTHLELIVICQAPVLPTLSRPSR